MPGTTRQNSSPHAARTSSTSSPETTTPSNPAAFASNASDAGLARPSPAWLESTVTATTKRQIDARLLRAPARPRSGGSHHRLAAERVDVQHRDAEPGDVGGRSLDGGGDVVELAVGEDRPVRGDAPDRLRPRRPRELEPHLQHPDVRSRGSRPVARRPRSSRRRGRRRSDPSGRGITAPPVPGTPRERAAAPGDRPATRHPSPSGTPAMPRAISTGAAGSTSTAVPTCTAEAPARSISTASSADRTPPTAMIGASGTTRAASKTARSVSGFSAGPDIQPVTGPERGAQGRGDDAERRGRPADREPVSAGPDARASELRQLGRRHRQLREDRHERHPRDGTHDLARPIDDVPRGRRGGAPRPVPRGGARSPRPPVASAARRSIARTPRATHPRSTRSPAPRRGRAEEARRR